MLALAPQQTRCPRREDLSAFTLGILDELGAHQISSHLEQGCPHCTSALLSIDETGDSLVSGLRDSGTPAPFIDESACQEVLQRLRDQPLELVPGAASDNQAAPSQIGPYQILEQLGRGAMGTVYKAFHSHLKRVVALKVLPVERMRDAAAVSRFQREMAAVGRLSHPHIVRATDAGQADGIHFLAMDFVAGTDLAQLVRQRGPLPVADVCELIRQAALGLQHAHENGLVHRDVKPSNLMLTPSGQVQVLDLGLAALRSGPQAEGELTEDGQVVGTFDYMAPEQGLDPRQVDARADIYGLGCTMQHLLTGRPPFGDAEHKTYLRKMMAHSQTPAPSVRERRQDVPEAVAAIVTRCLAKSPADRYPSAAELAEAVKLFTHGCELPRLLGSAAARPVRAVAWPSSHKRGRFVALAAMLLVLLGGGLVIAQLLSQLHTTGRFAGAGAPTGADVDREEVSSGPALAANDRADAADEPAERANAVYPTAIFAFEERDKGIKDYGAKTTDLLVAKLSANPNIVLVERAELNKILGELELNQSGAVKPDQAARVGQLTGAKLLVLGSVSQLDKRIYLNARIIGTETGIVRAIGVDGKSADELGPLVEKLSEQVADILTKQADKLVAKPGRRADHLAAIKQRLRAGQRPTVMVQVTERHIGRTTVDPATQTELLWYLKEAGFTVIDAERGAKNQADIVITGEGFSEFGSRHGNLVTVKARLEVKAVDRRTDKVIAVDRQTTIAVDLSEQIAGKTALQDAAAAIAERLLPKLAK